MSFLLRSHRPVAALRPYVQSIWYARGQVPYVRERILPTGTVVLLLKLGASLRLGLRAGEDEPETRGGSWICSLQSHYMINQPLGETHMAGVTFRPGGAYPFLGIPLQLISDGLIGTEELWRHDADTLRARLTEAEDLAQRFALIEQALLTRLSDPPARLLAIRWAADCLTRRDAPDVATLAAALGLSHKHMIALFAKYVGQPPKLVARIARFNRALDALIPGREAVWEQTALACGYYDQAHFNRDFRAFSGVNPAAYLNHRAPYHDHGLAPGKDVNFVPLGH